MLVKHTAVIVFVNDIMYPLSLINFKAFAPHIDLNGRKAKVHDQELLDCKVMFDCIIQENCSELLL